MVKIKTLIKKERVCKPQKFAHPFLVNVSIPFQDVMSYLRLMLSLNVALPTFTMYVPVVAAARLTVWR